MRASSYAKLETAAKQERLKKNRDWRQSCKEERRAYDKKYRADNGVKRRAWEKAHRDKNKGQIKQNQQKWRSLHPNYFIDKRANNPAFKMAKNIGCRLGSCRRKEGFKKTTHTLELLGCSWEEAVDHLHNNDRGLKLTDKDIHVDHIKPFAAFDNLQCPIQQRLVNHWSNLQLLTAEENLKKGASHDHAAWSVSEAGIKLLAFERELRAAAVNDDALVVYVDDSSDDDQDSEDDDE
ncbi:hypothetical protein T484DRAFT_1754358 [Baffinella frigidus]|nr:hypothetical protein T484DRAFT_1754358 [Cryptophyta sp. CCMP2293]